MSDQLDIMAQLIQKKNQILLKVHCKKRLPIFPSQAGMSLTKLSLAGNSGQ
jgi:hypothetical protein